MSKEWPSERKESQPIRVRKLARIFLAATSLMGKNLEAKPVENPASVLNAHLDRGRAREKEYAEDANAPRYETAADLRRAYEQGTLVEMPARGVGYYLQPALLRKQDPHHSGARYVRPELRDVLTHLGHLYHQKTHAGFRINSLSRPCEVQKHMGGNAIACDESSHVAAGAADIRYKDMSVKDCQAFESILAAIELGDDPQVSQQRIRVQATKEGIASSCYHVAAFREPSKSRELLARRESFGKKKR